MLRSSKPRTAKECGVRVAGEVREAHAGEKETRVEETDIPRIVYG